MAHSYYLRDTMADNFFSNLEDYSNIYGPSKKGEVASYRYGAYEAGRGIAGGNELIAGASRLAQEAAAFGSDAGDSANFIRNNAISLALTGGAIAARGYRQAGANALATAQYNSQVLANNLTIELDAFSREIQKVGATQRAQIGQSGFMPGSKSFLMVMNETISAAQRQTVIRRNAVYQKQQAIMFEGTMQKQAYDIQAQIAEITAQQAANNAADGGNDGDFGASEMGGGGRVSNNTGPAYNSAGSYVGYSSKLTGGYA